MSATDAYLENNAKYVANGGNGALPIAPSKRVAIITCMDARMDVFRLLGLGEGEAHVIRNAGGVVTDDALRSLIISQRLLGTQEVIIIHHTNCGVLLYEEDEFRSRMGVDESQEPEFSQVLFSNLGVDVQECIRRVRANPFVLEKSMVRGFIFDVATGKLSEIAA